MTKRFSNFFGFICDPVYYYSVTIFVASFAVAVIRNPWYGIGLGMLAASILPCTIIGFAIAFIIKRFAK
ncbi:hypothetical protein CVD25_11255 [Bacillus canaveralius]|uniref:Uncharacterized protein n=1 Tax=Bacillus canaveralius TaxID=1403243 RepID=A0A2N5GLR1_9BACI|nr:hypothetical protein [Bacillus canaveralius]PLR82802.1 hypothetical protein CU635_09940 [Bacillus canaveralius]PLR97193.1 hypothetical protein CVD25_11255 [Bacillus canaveralius]RSK45292.1 hypothetical protein EJA13_19665 [Bacillus canaveralius]